MKTADDFTAQALKGKCRSLSLAIVEAKAELFNRLMEKNPNDA